MCVFSDIYIPKITGHNRQSSQGVGANDDEDDEFVDNSKSSRAPSTSSRFASPSDSKAGGGAGGPNGAQVQVRKIVDEPINIALRKEVLAYSTLGIKRSVELAEQVMCPETFLHKNVLE